MEKISVVTVCYNCKDELQKTLDSVLSQTYGEVEYVIVDGGSTDGSLEMLRQHSASIHKLISEPDDGIYDAMNKGIRAATGEWIIFMNAGDIFADSDSLTKAMSKPIPADIDFLYSDYALRYPNGRRIVRPCDRSLGVVHHQNAIYRRRLHEQYGYYIVTHPYIVSDLMFFLAIPEKRFMKLQEPIAEVSFGGVSGGYWCAKQAWCIRYIYGLDTFPKMFLRLIKLEIGAFLRWMHLRK